MVKKYTRKPVSFVYWTNRFRDMARDMADPGKTDGLIIPLLRIKFTIIQLNSMLHLNCHQTLMFLLIVFWNLPLSLVNNACVFV